MLRPGDRIELLAMPEDPYPIERGSLGTVEDVHDLPFLDCQSRTQVWVKWDSGRSLSLIMPPDQVRVLSHARPKAAD